MFQSVDTSVSFPRLEEDILEWWATNGVVEKALSAGERPFVFFEGPPTANGPPGFHHTISRIFKDVVLRYRSMQGYHIIGRREGWDTHGLPVEIQVEKELGFSGKPDIERYGIAAFNAKCKESVWRYIQDWKAFTRRIAYWISDDAYITYEHTYIESLWWVFRQLWDRGLLFRDFKVTMHCPRCDTSLSDHEVSMGFRDNVDDPSVWVRFRVGDQAHPLVDVLAGSSLVAWTTTPWTLPANVALCVQPEATYALVRRNDAATGQDERLVVASALVAQVLGEGAGTGTGTGAGTEAGEAPPVEIERTFTGSELVGLRYEPLFEGGPPEGETAETVDRASAYRVIADEFVSLEDGTGIVHIAPAYGDLEIGRKYGLPTLFSVALNGEMLPQFADLGFGGTFFKQADPIITRHLKERGLLLRSGRMHHSYPFCWRCDTPLLYYAKRSWYIRTTAVKPELVANNQRVFWVPEHLRDGRFGNWLEHNIDWAISRERYWGTPLPVWVSDDGQVMECIGSVAELEQKAGRSLQGLDLHRPWVDEVTWEAPEGHGTMRRIPDVADCWFDSGAMQVAQWHYPFENRELFESAHPADYICEAVDQTRGWFYTLHAVSTLLFNKPSFLHVISLGHILDAEGRKMSKSLGNVVDPWAVFGRYGVDALRWNLFTASPPGNPRRFSEEQVGESLRQFLLTLWNTYAFFVTYANLDGWTPERQTGAEGGEEPARDPSPSPSLALIDRWALARLHALVRDVSASMEGYDVMSAARAIESFVDELSNWYVRRNRRRFWKSEADADKQAAYHTLYTCLVTVTKLVAPFAPFISESLYRNLVGEVDPAAPESVHLARWPHTDASLIDDRLVADMQVVMRVVSLGRAARKSSGVKVRQPLSEVWVRVATPGGVEGLRRFEDEVRDELNIKTVRYLDASTDFVEYHFKPNLRAVGKKYGKLVPALTAALREMGREEARAAAHAVERSLPFSLVVVGQTCELMPEEVLVETSSPEGYAVAEGDGTLVALNTSLTHELRLEGAARDLVRNVQDTRKSAGLAISDRIRLYLDAHDQGNGTGKPEAVRLQQVIAAWSDYVRAETLAVHLLTEPAPAGAYQETIELDGEQVTVGIVRCSEGEA